jgi:hypothetical protein
MSVVSHERLADGAAITAWVGWFFSHLTAANEFLQFIALVIAIISGLYAWAYHAKRLRHFNTKVDSK